MRIFIRTAAFLTGLIYGFIYLGLYDHIRQYGEGEVRYGILFPNALGFWEIVSFLPVIAALLLVVCSLPVSKAKFVRRSAYATTVLIIPALVENYASGLANMLIIAVFVFFVAYMYLYNINTDSLL